MKTLTALVWLLVASCTNIPQAKCPNEGTQGWRERVCQAAAACNLVQDDQLPDCEYCLARFASYDGFTDEQMEALLPVSATCDQLSKYGGDLNILQCTDAYHRGRMELAKYHGQ